MNGEALYLNFSVIEIIELAEKEFIKLMVALLTPLAEI